MSDASSIRLQPPKALALEIRPPGSKSISNRALLLAALADGRSELRGCLDSEDTQLMRACLQALGVRITPLDSENKENGADAELTDFAVDGHGAEFGWRARPQEPLYMGTAGTVARFLSAALASTGAPVLLDGSPRMRERPMGSLIDALRELGAEVNCLELANALPFELYGGPKSETKTPGPAPLRGGNITLERPASSQFVSALVYAGLFARSPLTIELLQGTPARPYVDMTLETVRSFGGKTRWLDEHQILVEPTPLRGTRYVIEPDASAASYFLGLATIYGGHVSIPDLGERSLQGDAQFHRVLAQMGAATEQRSDITRLQGSGRVHGADLDLTDMPDMTLTAAVVALFADSPTRIRGVGILRHHESDRIAAGATELRKLGALVHEHDDGLDIVPPGVQGNPNAEIRRGVSIDTYDDHRMAMAFAMAGDVEIQDPGCTRKTYPRYFDELARLDMVQRAP